MKIDDLDHKLINDLYSQFTELLTNANRTIDELYIQHDLPLPGDLVVSCNEDDGRPLLWLGPADRPDEPIVWIYMESSGRVDLALSMRDFRVLSRFSECIEII